MDISSKIKNVISLIILEKQLKEYIKNNIDIDEVFDDKDHYLLFKISPIKLLDLPYKIPALSDIVEIVPFVENINNANGEIDVGWNLFVDGINRMPLGSTKFDNIKDIFDTLKNGMNNVKEYNSNVDGKSLINFIISIIQNHNIKIDINAKPVNKSFYDEIGTGFVKSIMPGNSGKLFSQNKYLN